AVSYFYDLVLITLFSIHQDFWLLKKEILALCIAGFIFLFSYFLPYLQIKIFIIIIGAITGELIVVSAGLAKILAFFRKEKTEGEKIT
ncbi:MAG: hypothetical protein MJB14_17265, partial [Spirochaetes bacterium]|nr:hypothetical protein [Spirochaetota bacterium]